MTITPGSMGQMIKSGYIFRLTRDPIAKTLPLVIAERYHDILALSCFIVAIVIIAKINILVIPMIVIAVGLTILSMILKQGSLLNSITSLLSKIKVLKISHDDRAKFNESVNLFFRKDNLVGPWAISMIVSIFDALGIYTCFIALNIDVNILLSTAFGFTSVLFGAASFIPGGVGITEISFIKLLSDNGINIAAASAVVILMRLCSVWYSTFVGAIATPFASRLRSTKDLKV